MGSRRVVVAVVIGVVAVAAIVLYAHFKTDADQPHRLAGTTLDSQSFDLASYRGKRTVINFFGAWCYWCNVEAPDLATFSKAHPDVAFVGVDSGEQATDGIAFVQKFGLTYPVVSDPNGAIANQFKIRGYPTTFFLDANGVIRATIVGASDLSGFEAKLASVK
jgi:cytochrome c biogenesis protein CcmG/thiol:disulfide interchange protein DsbE